MGSNKPEIWDLVVGGVTTTRAVRGQNRPLGLGGETQATSRETSQGLGSHRRWPRFELPSQATRTRAARGARSGDREPPPGLRGL